MKLWSQEASPTPVELTLPESSWTTLDGFNMHWLDFDPGEGKRRATVVLIHGFGGYAAESLSIGRLARQEGIRLVAVDMPGCGLTPGFDASASMEAFTAFTSQVLAWAAGLAGSTPFVVAGHSTGCQMLLLSAVDWKQGVYGIPAGDDPVARAWAVCKGIFLLAPNGMKGEEGPLMALRSRWVSKAAKGLFSENLFAYLMKVQVHFDDRRVDPLISRLGAAYLMRPDGWENLMVYLNDVMGEPSLDGKLGLVDLPVRILWGRQDRVLGFDWNRKFLAELKNASLLGLEGCGHGIHHELPEKVVEELVSFLAGLE